MSVDQCDRLKCVPLSLTYSFETHSGVLYMADGHCCDMTGCVKLFQAIDPGVVRIQTVSGNRIDTAYQLDGDGWVAHDLSRLDRHFSHRGSRW